MMKTSLKRALALLVALACILTSSVAAFAQTPAEAHSAVLSYLVANVPTPIVNSVGGEWTILALARGDASVSSGYYDGYINRVKQTLRDNGGVLPGSSSKKTEYSRVVIALSSLGEDVTNFDGYNLLLPLANFDDVKAQGINGVTFALIAFDTCGWEIPTIADTAAQTTRQKLIDNILGRELTGGGFAQDSVNLAADTTAMALQALSPYQSQPAVATVIENAVAVLSTMQQPASGGFVYGAEGETAESAAQVVTALAALGINPTTDARFVKTGGNPLTALLKFQRPNGSFYHVAAGTGNIQMATEQAAYAVVAYDRFISGKTALYDMSDVAAAKLSAAKTAKLAAINAVTNGLNEADYTPASWAALQSAITQAVNAVNAATTIAQVNAVVVPTASGLVLQPDTALAEARAAKLAAINAVTSGLNEADYTSASWATLQIEITQAVNAVNAATTIAQVNAIVVPSTGGLVTKAAELANAKAKKITEINAVMSGLKQADYTAESWAALQSAIARAIADVNESTTVEAVNALVIPSASGILVARTPKWWESPPLPGWLHWILRYLLFGWIWMR